MNPFTHTIWTVDPAGRQHYVESEEGHLLTNIRLALRSGHVITAIVDNEDILEAEVTMRGLPKDDGTFEWIPLAEVPR